MDSYRTFIAVEIPRDLRQRIVEHIGRLRGELPELRASWSRIDNLHLSLKFLGNVLPGDIPKLSQAVARAAQTVSQFEITVSGCGTFPPRDRPKVLWIGAQAADLQSLHSAVEQECAAVGFPREARPFHPHLTIARLRTPQGAYEIAELHQRLGFAAQSFGVSEVVLFKSELLPEASKHTVISRHGFIE